jgi:nucleosome assembly protein 1-like 1
MASESSSSPGLPINQSSLTAPTPQNTPLNTAPITSQLSRPTVPDIPEDDDGEKTGGVGEEGGAMSSAILNMVQGKLQGIIGKSSGYIESLPVPVRKRIEGLKGVQAEFAKIEIQQKREILELDRKVSMARSFPYRQDTDSSFHPSRLFLPRI